MGKNQTELDLQTLSSALEGGSDTEDKDADKVSAPFHAPHLWWKACISGPDTEFPITVQMLLDNGAHIVLIHTDLVNNLNLCHHPLPEPETVDITVKTSNALS